MKKKDTRAEIINAGIELFSLQGYSATGIDAVLKRAGVPKGSFYHYFGSKEEFGLAVIDHFGEAYAAIVATFLVNPELTPLNRLRVYLETGLTRLTHNQCTRGCLLGNLGQELADQNERLRTRLDEIFRAWKGQLAACIEEAKATGELSQDLDSGVLAGFILSGLEGAMLRAKVMKSPKPMEDFIATLFATVLKSS
jgi:TetR/AcrR family transcriptional repressor of nem operon